MIFEYKDIYESRRAKCAGAPQKQPFIQGLSKYPLYFDLSLYSLPNGDPITGIGIVIKDPDTNATIGTVALNASGIITDGELIYGDFNDQLPNTCFYLEATLTGASGSIILRTDEYTPVSDCKGECSFLAISSNLNGIDCLSRFVGTDDDFFFGNEILFSGELSAPLPKYVFDRIDECTNTSTKIIDIVNIDGGLLSFLSMRELSAVLGAGTVTIREILPTANGGFIVASTNLYTLQTTQPFIPIDETCGCLFDVAAELSNCVCELDTCDAGGCPVFLGCSYEKYDIVNFTANQIAAVIDPTFRSIRLRFASTAIRNAFTAAVSTPSNKPFLRVTGVPTPFTVSVQDVSVLNFGADRAILTYTPNTIPLPFLPDCLNQYPDVFLTDAIHTAIGTINAAISLEVAKVRLKYTAFSGLTGVTPLVTYSYTNQTLYPTMVTQSGNILTVEPYVPPKSETTMVLNATLNIGFCSKIITKQIQQ